MTDTQTELTELYEAMCEAGIWPKEIYGTPAAFIYIDPNARAAWITDEHTIFIARGVAEGWLFTSGRISKTWQDSGRSEWLVWGDIHKELDALPAAIRYAHKMEKGGE